MPQLTRRRFLGAGAAVAATAVLGVGADAVFWEPNHPRLVEVEIPLDRLPEAWSGVRIIQLSDFHFDSSLSRIPIRRAIEIVNKLQPDLLVFTGDYVTAPSYASVEALTETANRTEPCAKLLAEMHAPMGSFAVLGNHDASANSERIIEILEDHRIPVLDNRSLAFERDGKRLWLAGIDDVLDGSPDLEMSLKGIPPDEPVVLLAHEPDFAIHVSRRNVDLQLSGHSHGGQIRVPFMGTPWLPRLARRFPMGMYRIRKLKLYTNVGLGTIRLPIRWNCPPEVTLITLRKGHA